MGHEHWIEKNLKKVGLKQRPKQNYIPTMIKNGWSRLVERDGDINIEGNVTSKTISVIQKKFGTSKQVIWDDGNDYHYISMNQFSKFTKPAQVTKPKSKLAAFREVVEINRRDRCTVVENAVGSMLEYDVEGMDTEQLWDLAVEKGIKVPGDGVTFDRDKLLSALQGETV
jgi:hypothetical protein